MRLTFLALAATAALTACGEPASPAGPEPAATPTAAAPATPATPADSVEAAPAPEASADGCGAAGRRGWVGLARADLPPAPDGANWRVYETGQPVTQDFRPERLNIEIDPDSQTVVRLGCG